MAQRGLEDWEIALIKRMMMEQYARDKMHAYFNRPDRTLTPAAYSEIKAGRFGKAIEPASIETLQRFVEGFARQREGEKSDPIGAPTISKLLRLAADGIRLIESEDNQIEFKASFSFSDNTLSKIMRAVAALANNSGGYIFCGVEDQTGKVLGLSSVTDFNSDIARWSTAIKGCLMPTPHFEKALFKVAGKDVGVIYVEEAERKPILANKNLGDKIRAGAIYYRYPGQSSEIGYGELSELLHERDRRAQRELLDNLSIFSDRTPDEVAVIDLKTGEMANGQEKIRLSQEFIDQLSVIKEGEFVEVGGAPAVRIVADAQVELGDQATRVVRGFTSDQSVARNFACREAVAEPLQYFSAAINSHSDWLPIFRWLHEAGVSHQEAIRIVEQEGLSPSKRRHALDRLAGKISAHRQFHNTYRIPREMFLKGETPKIETATELRRTMSALRMMTTASPEQVEAMWRALKIAFDFAWQPAHGGDLQSYVKAAAGRLDELIYRERLTAAA